MKLPSRFITLFLLLYFPVVTVTFISLVKISRDLSNGYFALACKNEKKFLQGFSSSQKMMLRYVAIKKSNKNVWLKVC